VWQFGWSFLLDAFVLIKTTRSFLQTVFVWERDILCGFGHSIVCFQAQVRQWKTPLLCCGEGELNTKAIEMWRI